MDTPAMFGSGLITFAVMMFFIYVAILTFLLPIFVYRIRNEIISMSKIMDEISTEIAANKLDRKLMHKSAKLRKNKSITKEAIKRMNT